MAKVLLIDDNPIILENIKEMLEIYGLEVIAVSNGENGIMVAREEQPNLILCDASMPGMNGYEVLKTIKGDPRVSGITFLFLSAYASEQEVESGLKMGAQGYLIKSIDPDELVKRIASFI